jgi:hypothetical protein
MRLPATLFTLLLLTGAAPGAAPRASDEILAAVQVRLVEGGEMDSLIDELDDLPLAELRKLAAEVEKAWSTTQTAYLSAFEAEARSQYSGRSRQENTKRIRDLRTQFHKVRGMPEGAMKEALKTTSRPAIDELRELLLPKPDRILKIGGPDLQNRRLLTLRLAEFRQGVRTATVATGDENSAPSVTGRELEIAADLSGLDRDGLRIMAENRKIAAKAEIPEPERIGIEDLNQMRLLVGIGALRIDPKLCEAARGHSEDMQKLGFFAHDSPVPGKRTPSARAAKAGTSGGAENIYMGSTKPLSANKGWFYSPGHHKNMFNPGHGRVGLGNYGSHWTQMLGR